MTHLRAVGNALDSAVWQLRRARRFVVTLIITWTVNGLLLAAFTVAIGGEFVAASRCVPLPYTVALGVVFALQREVACPPGYTFLYIQAMLTGFTVIVLGAESLWRRAPERAMWVWTQRYVLLLLWTAWGFAAQLTAWSLTYVVAAWVHGSATTPFTSGLLCVSGVCALASGVVALGHHRNTVYTVLLATAATLVVVLATCTVTVSQFLLHGFLPDTWWLIGATTLAAGLVSLIGQIFLFEVVVLGREASAVDVARLSC